MLQSTHWKVSSWLPWASIAILGSVYLLFAPNYQWVERTSNPAYGADFLQEWVGARMIVTGQAADLYHLETFRNWQYDSSKVGFEWTTDQFFPPVYPPPHYLLFSPLALLPYRWATLVWLMLLLVAAIVASKTIADIVDEDIKNSMAIPQENRSRMWEPKQFLWIGLLLFPSVLFSITLGQKSILWLLFACWTWKLLQRNQDWKAGFLFGFMSLKPTMFFLLPMVMLRYRRWSFLSGSITSTILLWGTAACIIPWSAWSSYAQNLSHISSYAENSGYRLDWSCNLMTIAYAAPAEWTSLLKIGFCIPLAIYILYSVVADYSHSLVSPEKAMMIFAATLLVSPHCYSYDLCVLLLPILWCMGIQSRTGVAYYALIAVATVLASDLLVYLQLPIIPIVLVAIVCELRLRKRLTERNRCADREGSTFCIPSPSHGA